MIVKFCMFLAAYPPMMATLCYGWGRCAYGSAKATLGTTKFGGAWLHHSPMLALVHHRSNPAAPEFLQMVAHNFVAHLLLGPWKNLLLQSFLFYFFFAGTRSPSSNQTSFPSRKSLNFPSYRGKFSLATLKPPLSFPLIYLLFFKS
jgi:hypothetical protein